MTTQEFAKILRDMPEGKFEEFRRAVGAGGSGGATRDWYIDHFTHNPQLVERKYCHYLNVPTEEEKAGRSAEITAEATVSAAQSAKVSADAAVKSAQYTKISAWASCVAVIISIIALVRSFLN